MKVRGFSLLEVVVALTIVGTVFTVVFRGLSVSIDTLNRVEDSNRRIELVRSKLAEIDLCPWIRAGEQVEGSFDDGTRWSVATSEFIAPTAANGNSLMRIQLNLEWQGTAGNQRREITTYRFVSFQQYRPTPVPSLEEQLRELR